jgi:LAO/AO transport system kinase
VSRPPPSPDFVRSLVEDFRHGSRRALARLITCVQDGCDTAPLGAVTTGTQLAYENPKGHSGKLAASPFSRAVKVGLTGAAGVGKSTLAAALIRHVRQMNKSVAVVACDPMSPLTGGALLGDRIRMQASAVDAGVFIRSLSTRGAGGGVSDSTSVIVALLEQFGFDVILVETIGVGQDQLAVRRIVDVLVLLVTPASGDRIQWQKAGLLEVADVVVVNKADLPGADETVVSLRHALDLPSSRASSAHRRNVVVLPAVTTIGRGIPEVWQAVESSYGRAIGEAPADAMTAHSLMR